MSLRNLQYPVAAPAASASAVTPYLTSTDITPYAGCLLPFVEAPALTVSQLPNGATVTFTLLESNDPTFTTNITSTVMGVQTGASGTGAAAATFCAEPAYAGGKYMAMKIAASSGVNLAGISYTLMLAGFAR